MASEAGFVTVLLLALPVSFQHVEGSPLGGLIGSRVGRRLPSIRFGCKGSVIMQSRYVEQLRRKTTAQLTARYRSDSDNFEALNEANHFQTLAISDFSAQAPDKAKKQAQKALEKILKVSEGDDHPGVAVSLRSLAVVSQISEGGNTLDGINEVMAYVKQAREMWKRMYGGAYKEKLGERIVDTMRRRSTGPRFAELDGLLTPKDCEHIIGLTKSRIDYQEVVIKKKIEEDFLDDEEAAELRKASDADTVVLKFYESFVLARLAQTAALLTGVPLNRIGDPYVTFLNEAEAPREEEIFGYGEMPDGVPQPDRGSFIVFLNDDIEGGEIQISNLEGKDYVVEPLAGKLLMMQRPNTTDSGAATFQHRPCSKGKKWVLKMEIKGPLNQNWINYGNLDPLMDPEVATMMRAFDLSKIPEVDQ